MIIYQSILTAKPHNAHYLNRYIKFIEYRKVQNVGLKRKGNEAHHICPKANDLFPEYTCFKANKWNKIILTHRHHFIELGGVWVII